MTIYDEHNSPIAYVAWARRKGTWQVVIANHNCEDYTVKVFTGKHSDEASYRYYLSIVTED